MKMKILYAALSVFALTSMASCDDDDDDNYVGSTKITIENVTEVKDFVQSGMFSMTGTAQPVILPGESVSITFYAGKGQALMFSTMYGYSNDVFFAPENPGINLFDANGNAVTGDVSSQVKLWDNGTRINQAPGSNVTHPGTAENGNVTMINGIDPQGNTYLQASELMKLTLDYVAASSQFTLTIENISGGKANETPFSPGVWVVSNKSGNGLVNETPFFKKDEKSTEALTALAESGNNQLLGTWASDKTGIITGLSPTVVVVYSGETNPLFQLGEKDKGIGLKELAQKGDGTKLKESLQKMSNVMRVYVVGSSAAAPGQKMEQVIETFDGYNLAYATMFGYSNDWFYANKETISSKERGDITGKTALYDSGTGVNQYPGAGNSQALFGGTPAAESNNITQVGNTYPVPEAAKIIKVTLH